MVQYGSREKAAFNSLGMRPVEILENREDSVRLEEVVDELKEDEEVETVLQPLVRRYFKVLSEKDMVEYDDSGSLYTAGNRLVQKNGVPDQDIQRFVESFDADY